MTGIREAARSVNILQHPLSLNDEANSLCVK
jgi:hypothetical protein